MSREPIETPQAGHETPFTNPEFYRTLLEGVPAAIYAYSVKRGGVYYSPEVEKIFGVPRQEMYANPQHWKHSIHTDDSKRVENAVAQILQGSVQQFNIEYRVKKSSGEWLWLHDRIFRSETHGDDTILIGFAHDITDQKNSQRHIESLSQRLTLATDSSKLGIWDWDVKKNEMIWDYRMMQLYGQTIKTFPGGIQAWHNGLHPEDRDATIALCEAALRGEKEWDTEFRILLPDGAIRYVKANGIVLRSPDGTPERMLGVNADITSTKQAYRWATLRLKIREAAAANTPLDQLMQMTVDAAEELTESSIGFFHLVKEDQENLRLTAWSSRTMKTMCSAEGKGSHYPISKAGVWVECFHTQKPVIHNDYATLTHKKGMPEGHAPVRRQLVVPLLQNGRVVSILGVGNKRSPYDDDDIRVIQDLISYVTDLMENKRVEEARRASDSRFLFAMEASRLGAWTLDLKSKTTTRTALHDQLFGYPTPLPKWTYEMFLEHIVPEDRARAALELENMARGTGPASVEFRIRRADGQIRWLWAAGSPDKNADGVPLTISGIIQDITERKQAEMDKAEVQAQLFHSAKLASIGTLAAGVAHEINNPLAIIKGNISLVEERLSAFPGTEQMRDFIQRSDKALERIKNIVAGLRTFARADSEVIEPTDINKVVRDTLAICETIYKKENLAITFSPGATQLCKGNLGKLQQVLMNLITNARDACLERKKSGTIGIETFERGGNLFLQVTDNGPGIPEELLDRIFEPFFTTKAPGKGTGLGLRISQSIIQTLGGTMTVHSSTGEGTTFLVSLPITTDTAKAARESSTEAKKTTLQGRLLIVDDEDDIREILSDAAASLGLTTQTACDGLKALEVLKTETFDFLITDLQMPAMGGEALLKEILKLPHLKQMARLVITGGILADTQDDRSQALNALAHATIQKPFDRKTLAESLIKAGAAVKA